MAERFPELHAIYAGASYPGTNLCYEFVVGLQIADTAFAWLIIPPQNYLPSWLNSISSSG